LTFWTISLAALFVVYVFSEDLLSSCKHLLCVHKTLSSKLFIVKSSTKQSQILRKQNTELKTELKEKKETVKSMKKENYYKKLQGFIFRF
jgi:hypothetical protein